MFFIILSTGFRCMADPMQYEFHFGMTIHAAYIRISAGDSCASRIISRSAFEGKPSGFFFASICHFKMRLRCFNMNRRWIHSIKRRCLDSVYVQTSHEITYFQPKTVLRLDQALFLCPYSYWSMLYSTALKHQLHETPVRHCKSLITIFRSNTSSGLHFRRTQSARFCHVKTIKIATLQNGH